MKDLPPLPRFLGNSLLAFALAGVLLWSGACCARRSDPPVTGLRGTVMKGPMCPGPQRRDHPCPDAPVAGEFQVLDEKGAPVASFRSDEAGRFLVELPAGTFTIVPQGHGLVRNPLGGSARVTLTEGVVLEVALRWDTGLR